MMVERTGLWLSLPALAGVTPLASCATRFLGGRRRAPTMAARVVMHARAHAIGA